MLNAGSGLEAYGGADRFVTVVKRHRRDAHRNGCAALGPAGAGTDDDDGDADDDKRGPRRGVLTLSSGDNFLAGPEFSASLEKGVPFYDSIVVSRVRYNALALGNHEFDFGPDVLVEFIEGVRGRAKFLSANLDFSAEPGLQDLVDQRRIAKSTVVRTGGKRIGIVGATTEDLSFISSPRNVIINDIALAVQAEIDGLQSKGINKIVLISHLQSINEDLELLQQLSGVDVAIAGGGDEVLANEDDLLVPGDEEAIFGQYPIIGMGGDGSMIPVVTTAGNFKYLGRLEVLFDQYGNVVASAGGPIRVAGGSNPDAVEGDLFIRKTVIEPVTAALADLASTAIGTSEVELDGTRANVRTVESNLGNLIADALLAKATDLAFDFDAPVPDVALQNGGGIRNDDIQGPGDITGLDTFDILPFSNFVTIVPNIPREQFKEILENAVSQVENTSGRFAQVAGFKMTWDPNGTAQELDSDSNLVIPGTRVVDVVLDDGTEIVKAGTVVLDPELNIATIDFLARGGDQYPYRGVPFTSVGISYQQALSDFIQDDLGEVITAADFPKGGEGRITRLN